MIIVNKISNLIKMYSYDYHIWYIPHYICYTLRQMYEIHIKYLSIVGVRWVTLPKSIKTEMYREQARQGNDVDKYVFYKNILAKKSEGGFNWNDSIYGPEYWSKILSNE